MLDMLNWFSEAMIWPSAATWFDVQYVTDGILRYYHELLGNEMGIWLHRLEMWRFSPSLIPLITD